MQFIDIQTEQILPNKDEVLKSQGISNEYEVNTKFHLMVKDAINIFMKYANPNCMYKEISIEDFDEMFKVDTTHVEETPLKKIYPQANNLAIFAVTLGDKISYEIENLFKENDFALGYILDSVASIAADNSVEILEKRYFKNLYDKTLTNHNSIVLSYSPGYCGWLLSSQNKLFQYLNPGQIGITLNESFLMTPLKSVTGVLIHGHKEIHRFENNFDFCRNCKNQTCIDRMEKIFSR